MRIPPFNPYIALSVGVIAISTSAIFVKLATEAPTSILAAYRLFFALLLMAPIIIVSYKQTFTSIRVKEWGLYIGAGICLALYFIFWFESLRFTTVASSTVLVSLHPIVVFVATYVFSKVHFSARAIISSMITLIGSFIIIWGDFRLSNAAFYGDILAVIGAIAVGGYLVIGQQARKKIELIPYTFIVYGIGALFLVGYNIVIQAPFFPYPTDYWTIFFALAIIPTFFGQWIFHWALKWVSISIISIAIVFEPVGATILASIIFGESITWHQWLGGSIVLTGLLLFIVSTTRKNKVTISTSNDF